MLAAERYCESIKLTPIGLYQHATTESKGERGRRASWRRRLPRGNMTVGVIFRGNITHNRVQARAGQARLVEAAVAAHAADGQHLAVAAVLRRASAREGRFFFGGVGYIYIYIY